VDCNLAKVIKLDVRDAFMLKHVLVDVGGGRTVFGVVTGICDDLRVAVSAKLVSMAADCDFALPGSEEPELYSVLYVTLCEGNTEFMHTMRYKQLSQDA
jgi:hypothetical protein